MAFRRGAMGPPDFAGRSLCPGEARARKRPHSKDAPRRPAWPSPGTVGHPPPIPASGCQWRSQVMGIGQSSALLIIGAVLRWLALPTRHLSIRAIGLVYINFSEIGLVLMIGGAVSLLGWVLLLAGRAPG